MSEQQKQGWLEQRLPIVSAFRREYIDFPMPPNLNFLWNFGAFATIALGFLVISGIFLALNYTPSINGAFASVETIDRSVAWGWFIRGLHMGGVTMLFGSLYIHMGRGLYYGSYKAPREVLWLTGMGLFVLVMIIAFAGYVLPWGQMSFWGATVIVNALGAIPVIGQPLSSLLFGEAPLGDMALHRMFVVHFALAFGAMAVIALHVAALHVTGSNNPTGVPTRKKVPFHPYYTTKDSFGICLFLMVYAVLVFFLPGILTLADNYIEANPMVTPADITPEWYFAPFYAILRAVPSRLGGLLATAGLLLVVVAVPWLDRGPIRSARFRPVIRLGLGAAFIAFIALGIAGMQSPDTLWIWTARIAACVWFGFFLVLLPWASKHDDPSRVVEAD